MRWWACKSDTAVPIHSRFHTEMVPRLGLEKRASRSRSTMDCPWKGIKTVGKERGGQGVRAYTYIGISYEFQTYRFCQHSCVFFASHRQLDNGNFYILKQ